MNDSSIFNAINTLYIMGILLGIGFLLLYIATKLSEQKTSH